MRKNRALPLVDFIEVLLDDPQGQVMIALHSQHKTKTINIGGRIRPVTSGGATGRNQFPILEKAELRRREVGELGSEFCQDLADGEKLGSAAFGCRSPRYV